MTATEVILILAGAFLCLSLIFVVFTLCRHLRSKKNKLKNIKMPPVDYKPIYCPYNGDILSSLRTVEPQLPLNNSVENRLLANSPLASPIRERTPTILVPNENCPNHRLFSDRLDNVFQDELFVRRARTTSQLEIKRHKISQGAMEHLGRPGYYSADLNKSRSRPRSRSEVLCNRSSLQQELDLPDNDNFKVSTESLFSDSDQSGSSISSAGNIECNVKHLSSIKKKLASNRNSKQIQLSRKKKIGIIAMKTNFQNNTNSLEIWISQIIHFSDKTQSSSPNYFVILSIMPEKVQTKISKSIKGSNELNFDEQFCFNDIDMEKIHLYSIKIKLIRHSAFKQKQIIGEAQIRITDLKNFCEPNICLDLFLNFKSKASKASLNISLCHQATISKLDVIIIQAKQLPKFLNPFVTVSLFREEGIETKNTSIKYNTRDPLFNQSIEFDISTDISNPLSVFTMVVTVNDSSLMGKTRVIGHVVFSLYSPQKSAATHWKLVQNSPHLTHTEWHSLIDPNEI